MAHFRQFLAAHGEAGHYSRQEKIETRGLMVEAAGRYANDRYLPDSGQQGHVTRQDRGAIDPFPATRIHQSLARHVIRIHR